MINKPYPNLESILKMVGAAGLRMSEIDASEGAAGNISVYMGWDVDVKELFPNVEKIILPQVVPELAGARILVSGSGRRLREIGDHPTANVACLVVDAGGKTADQYTSPDCLFHKITTEFNSHLAVHYNRVTSTGTNFQALVHAQPPYITYLSHIKRYQDLQYLNTHLLRWQPETIVNLPEGIGFAPFKIPGSKELVEINAASFRIHKVVLWAKHGVMSASEISVKNATDRIEYAEAGARYEYLNLTVGEMSDGLSVDEIRDICTNLKIKQEIF